MDCGKNSVNMKENYFHICFIFFLIIFVEGCGVTQPVRVLKENETRAIASLGGPVVVMGGMSVPIPYLTAGIAHGFSENVTLTSTLHLTTLAFKSLGIDAGVSSALLHEHSSLPEITLHGQIYFFDDFVRGNNPRIFPMATVNASYHIGERTLAYFGADNLYQIHQPQLFFSPFIGMQFPLSIVLAMQIETKWMAANINTAHGVFEGTGSINSKGNFGLFVGFQYSLQRNDAGVRK